MWEEFFIDGPTKLNSDVSINSDILLKGNLSVDDRFILLNTNSLIPY